MRLLILAVVVIALALGVWKYGWQPRRAEARRQDVLARLPAPPDRARFNQPSLEAFEAAVARAQEHPLSADAVGELGMLYHAYQLLDPARVCYELARALAPGELRWIYYAAVLEKAAFRLPESEALYHEAIDLRPDSAQLRAELGDLYLQWERRVDAAASLQAALERDPRHPLAALGQARLALVTEDWERVIAVLDPLLESYPLLARAHRYLALAHESLGRLEERDHHREAAEYGSAFESPLMRELYELAVDALVEGGDPSRGEELVRVKCGICHTRARIDATRQDRRWWAWTVRHMQRLAGPAWLDDEEAASVVAYLAAQDAARRSSR